MSIHQINADILNALKQAIPDLDEKRMVALDLHIAVNEVPTLTIKRYIVEPIEGSFRLPPSLITQRYSLVPLGEEEERRAEALEVDVTSMADAVRVMLDIKRDGEALKAAFKEEAGTVGNVSLLAPMDAAVLEVTKEFSKPQEDRFAAATRAASERVK